MRYPKKLMPGDTIGLIAPSSPITPEKRDASIRLLEEMGYRVKIADNVCKVKGGFMAGSGQERAEWMNQMFLDPEVDAIFCLRGGDSGTRTWKYLDVEAIRNNPKLFVGYSDITTFHLIMNQMCDFVTYHGPMVASNMIKNFDEESRNSLFEAINAEGRYEYKNPAAFPIQTMNPGKASGVLTGGNITLLCTSIGTPYEVDTRGKILFLEEVGGQVDFTERQILQLVNSGKMDQCVGVLIGQFEACHNQVDASYDMIEMLRELFEDLKCPVLYNIQSGHGFPMTTLPMGAVCHMDADQQKIWFEGR